MNLKTAKPNSGRFKKGHTNSVGEKNAMYKGDKACYASKHYWIYRRKGKPNLCEECGTITAKRFEWANISGEYKRDLDDWKRLCTSCHRKMDMTDEWRKNMSLARIKYYENKIKKS